MGQKFELRNALRNYDNSHDVEDLLNLWIKATTLNSYLQ
jgi:hypothetical protein